MVFYFDLITKVILSQMSFLTSKFNCLVISSFVFSLHFLFVCFELVPIPHAPFFKKTTLFERMEAISEKMIRDLFFVFDVVLAEGAFLLQRRLSSFDKKREESIKLFLSYSPQGFPFEDLQSFFPFITKQLNANFIILPRKLDLIMLSF
jgi:hypothetical protein